MGGGTGTLANWNLIWLHGYTASQTFSRLGFYLPLDSYPIFSWGFLLTVENLGFLGEVALCLGCGNVITTIAVAWTEDGVPMLSTAHCPEELLHGPVELF